MSGQYALTQHDRAILLALRAAVVEVIKENPSLADRLAQMVAKDLVKPSDPGIGPMATDQMVREQLKLIVEHAAAVP